MSKRINKNQIAEKGVLDNLLEPLKDLLKISDRVDSSLKSTAQTIKKSFDFKESSKGLRDLEKNLKRTNKLAEDKKNNQQEQTKIQRKLANAQERLNELSTEEAKQLVETREKLRQKKKALKDSGNAYKELSNESRDLKNESKRLGAELIKLENNGEKNTKEFRKLEKQYQETTSQARKTDTQLKDLDKTVGDNFRNVGNYESATDKLTGSLKNLAGAIGIGAVVNGFKDFALQASKAENMARTFFDTNEEGTKEIAKEANILSKVYGKEVNEVLKSSNALSKQFGITGQESIALLNEGFAKGGDVSGELLENISEYSTQLRLAGLNAEESISIITESQRQGVFSDKGVDAIKEATLSLRELTPPAQDALKAIGMSAEQVQKDIASGSKSYFDIIQEVSSKTKEVGEESQAAGMVLADIFKGAGEDAGKFIFQLDEMNTSLDDLEDQNKGLDGAVKNLTRSWNEFLYGVNEGTGAMDSFASVINFVADNLSTIISTLTTLAGTYLVIKARQKALNLQLKSGGSAAKAFGRSMKSIGFAGLIAAAIELAKAFYDIASGAARARFETDLFNRAQEQIGSKEVEQTKKINSSLQEKLKLIRRERELNNITAKEAKRQREEAIKGAKSQLTTQRDRIEDRIKQEKKMQKAINQVLDNVIEKSVFSREFIEKNSSDILNKLGTSMEELFGIDDPFNRLSESEAIVKSLESSLDNLIDTQGRVNETGKELNHQYKVNAKVVDGSTKAVKDNTDALKKQRVTMEDIDVLLNEGQSLEQIESEEIAQENERIQRNLDKRLTMINDYERKGLLTKEDAADQRVLAELDALLRQKEILEQYGRDTVEIEKQISQKRLEVQGFFKEKELEKEKEKGKELLETADEIQQALTEVYADAVDRRIAKIEEEKNAAKEQQNFLQELAAQGQIDAQQSILATKRQREQLEREQQKLEKRKAQIQLISGGLTSYANAIEQGQSPAEALTSTIANTQLLVNGLKSIQAFKEGSEDVGNGGKMDNDGGFLAMLHPKERVMTAEQNAKVSGISNPLLAEIGHKFKSGELTEQGGVYGYDLNAVVSRLDSLEKTIQNKPENYVDFESIAGKMYLNHKMKKGRTVIHNKYKVKD